MVPYEYDFIRNICDEPAAQRDAFWRDSPLSAEVVYVQPLALQGHISMGRNSEI